MAASLVGVVSTPLKSTKDLIGPTSCEGFAKDLQGWNSHHSIFQKLVEEVRPKVYVECGVWKGLSLLNVANLTRDMGTVLYACDTWLGGIDHTLSEKPVDRLPKDKWGYPMLYHQFLFNVAGSGHEGRIFPVVQTSVNCARWLKAKGVVADLVYIDGSHEGWDPLFDMDHYWNILPAGGVMFGDDLGFPGVQRSVNHFSMSVERTPEIIDNNFWIIRK